MAAFCKDCFKHIIALEDIPDCNIILSEDLDLCESCEEWKQVVLKVKEKEYE